MIRKPTRPVSVGGITIGGGAPISVQSMTNTDTRDIDATVAQVLALEREGCEIVRVSVYDMECASAIRQIKARVHLPLVADIHFDHRLAIASIENGIDKLRINPGNIGSQAKVRELAAAAKSAGIPIRIGVNAGSLQKDILKRDGGPTPKGMVESALEHVALLEREGFEDIVISIKASGVANMVEACRLMSRSAPYPLHIGVTEAGLGDLALTKSAMGVGALLLDGIGDTIRISLTGDPVKEVEAGWNILRAAGARQRGIEIISCPTCGRTNGDLEAVVKAVQASLPETKAPLKIAIMGCAVNGPGEAAEADAGVAFGPSNAVLFAKGSKLKTVARECAVQELIELIRSFIN